MLRYWKKLLVVVVVLVAGVAFGFVYRQAVQADDLTKITRARVRDERCIQLVRNVVRYKLHVAAEYRLTRGQAVHLQLLRAEGLGVDRIDDGRIICPHGKVIDLGVVGSPPTPAFPFFS